MLPPPVHPASLCGNLIYEVFPRIHSPEGTLQGVTADLSRMRDLGADYLYLMPIHPIGELGRKGRYGSPYAVRDYRAIDPALGTFADFKQLINEAHRLGLKVLMDIVFHHTSPDSELAREHPEWFSRDEKGQPKSKVAEWTDIVDLDYTNRELWDYQIETLAHWARLGVDGFRCDVAPLVPLDFWLEARHRLDPQHTLLWLAESGFMCFVKKDKDLGIPHASDPELHRAFHMTYDCDGGEYWEKYLRGEARLGEYLHQVYLQDTMYPADAVKLRLLENHDNPRAAFRIPHRPTLRNWTALMALLPGALMLYAGQEYALDGTEHAEQGETSYHHSKIPIPWEKGDASFLDFTHRLIQAMKEIKRTCHACCVRELAYGVVLLEWTGFGPDRFRCLLNLEMRCGVIPLAEPLGGHDLLTGQSLHFEKTLSLAPEPLLLRQ